MSAARKSHACAKSCVLEGSPPKDRLENDRAYGRFAMNRVKLVGALAATAILTGSLPLLAEPLTWPWKDKTPSDPALVQLSSVENVTAAINKSAPPTVTVTVA